MSKLNKIIEKHLEDGKPYSLISNNCGKAIFNILLEAGLLTKEDLDLRFFNIKDINRSEALADFCDNCLKFEQVKIEDLSKLKVAVILYKLESNFTNHVILYYNKKYFEITQKLIKLTEREFLDFKNITRIYKIKKEV